MKQLTYTILFLFFFSWVSVAQVASPPFWSEISEFRKQDSVSMPPKNAILFVGSSSFRLWENVSEMFPGHTIINRGFGGSTLLDLIRYTDQIVYPYAPKQIVIYSGENDLAPGDVTPDTVFQRFKKAYELIRSRFAETPVLYVSIKPSPSRNHLKHLMIASNNRIRDFLQSEKNARFIDVFTPMLDAQGNPRQELFVADDLHMNARGYELWKSKIEPHLIN